MRRLDERGGTTVEIVVVTPLLILVLLLVVAGGRITSAHSQVDGAARDAARSASMKHDASSAVVAADASVAASLQGSGASCRTHDVQVDTTHFRAGGYVAVSVTCTTSLADLTLLRLPGSRTVDSRFVEPIDAYSAVSG